MCIRKDRSKEDNMEEYYLICEDSLEGIFTGVYDAYLWKQPLERVHLLTREEDNYRLFAQYQNCVPDQEKTKKVAARVMKTFGMEAYFSLCEVAASHEEDKAEAILRTIVHGLSDKLGFTLLNDLRDPGVYRTFVMARNVGKEIHFHKEFLRFEELEGGILYAQIGPKNNIITFLMPHFADRLPMENFVIHDVKRNIFALHEAKKDWYLVYNPVGLDKIKYTVSDKEKQYSELFAAFFHTIAIKERENPTLQLNMLPLRYREYMTEFRQNVKTF